MKYLIAMTLCLLLGSPVYATSTIPLDKAVMNIFELGIKTGKISSMMKSPEAIFPLRSGMKAAHWRCTHSNAKMISIRRT